MTSQADRLLIVTVCYWHQQITCVYVQCVYVFVCVLVCVYDTCAVCEWVWVYISGGWVGVVDVYNTYLISGEKYIYSRK